MSALSDALSKARAENRAALIGYLPVGYPDVDTSIEAERSSVRALYAHLLQLAEGSGVKRPAATTPSEHVPALSSALPTISPRS